MEEPKVISGNTETEIWAQIEQDFAQNPDLFEYSAIIEQPEHTVVLDIDIDLGGGFEGGYALTRFVSNLKTFDDFRFSLHPQDFIDGIGKLVGMQDIEIGYPEFDKKIIVKTNHPERVKDILSDSAVRETLLTLPDFNFHIGHHHSDNAPVESAFLELRIEDGITEIAPLKAIYKAFLSVLKKMNTDEIYR